MLLELQKIEAGYDSSRVLFGIDLAIKAGEVVSLLGRNGMGKTTTVRTITGLLPSNGGDLRFDGRSVTRTEAYRIARLGVALVPEGREIFPTLTVRENLIATASNRLDSPSPWTLDRVERLFPILAARAGQRAGLLSGGEQQMLAIGRALLTNPKLLILDEATEGLAPVVRQDVWQSLKQLRGSGLSILVIDKNLNELKTFADRHYVMSKGNIVWNGSTKDLEHDGESVASYLHV